MSKSPATSRVIAILELLAASPAPLSASAIARAASASTSTTALIMDTLDTAGYAERLPDKTYQLGIRVMALLRGLEKRYPLLGAANEELTRLHGELGWSCSLARVTDKSQEVILTAGPAELLGIRPGIRIPMTPPLGTLAMAWRRPDEIDAWLGSNGSQLASRQKQLETLRQVRELGYGVYGMAGDHDATISQIYSLLTSSQPGSPADNDNLHLQQLARLFGLSIYSGEELRAGKRINVSHVIAPVFGSRSQPVYLLSVHLVEAAVTPAVLDVCIKKLLASADRLTGTIGGVRASRQSSGNKTRQASS